jgi:hypothetical protein
MARPFFCPSPPFRVIEVGQDLSEFSDREGFYRGTIAASRVTIVDAQEAIRSADAILAAILRQGSLLDGSSKRRLHLGAGVAVLPGAPCPQDNPLGGKLFRADSSSYVWHNWRGASPAPFSRISKGPDSR